MKLTDEQFNGLAEEVGGILGPCYFIGRYDPATGIANYAGTIPPEHLQTIADAVKLNAVITNEETKQ